MWSVREEEMKLGVFVCGYNCALYVQAAMDSIKEQTVKDFVAVCVDDCSTDLTAMILNGTKDERFTILRNDTRRGGTMTRLRACQELAGMGVDVMVMLDMDDQLLPGALERIAVEYDKGAWMTYGNWIDEKGCICPHRPMSEEAYSLMWGATANWIMTHAMTFSSRLWAKIPNANWFHADGSPFGSGQSDANLMLSLAALAGPSRIHGIPEPIYRYTRFGSASCLRLLPASERNGDWGEIVSRPRPAILEAL